MKASDVLGYRAFARVSVRASWFRLSRATHRPRAGYGLLLGFLGSSQARERDADGDKVPVLGCEVHTRGITRAKRRQTRATGLP